ncbi:ribonuclease H [Prochlorococcus sp. MIT 1300]|uniref:ribonuclease H family protein n=1 Tax=Prochlorococcus sp. MIT 1300 TaxID=3096218 RepID=UPI002A761215|nr:ribonuclease H [Prochlorococcus sp. MIT 1300]
MSKPPGRVIAAATDGACSGNPGPGGWAALIRFEDGSIEEFAGFEPATTNNRMELQAALNLLKTLKSLPIHPNLKIRTDSKYLIDGLEKWMPNWKRKGWLTAAGKPVMNQDLWKELDQANINEVAFSYVKGHSGDPDNDRVDKIAVSFSKGQSIELHSRVKGKVDSLDALPFQTEDTDIKNKGLRDLNTLLSRLEIVNKISTEGYSLEDAELAELVNLSIKDIKNKTASWYWRDWLIEPITSGRWKIISLIKDNQKP